MMRVKFPLPQPRPETPIKGPALTAVGFGEGRLRRLATAARREAGSRWAVIKPKRVSRGVLWRGRPFYWSCKGYYRAGKGDRRPLQHLIWESYRRRRMPAGHEIFFQDRDRHNFTRSNLRLLSKAAVHKLCHELGETCQLTPEERGEVAGKRWTRHSRNTTALLLKHFNQKTTSHANANEQHLNQIESLRRTAEAERQSVYNRKRRVAHAA